MYMPPFKSCVSTPHVAFATNFGLDHYDSIEESALEPQAGALEPKALESKAGVIDNQMASQWMVREGAPEPQKYDICVDEWLFKNELTNEFQSPTHPSLGW